MVDSRLPTIALSMGDPAGIGPEVTFKALTDPSIRSLARCVVVGEGWLAKSLGAELAFQPDAIVTDLDAAPPTAQAVVLDTQFLDPSEWTIAEVSAKSGQAAVEYVRRATELCQQGAAIAIVTAPINKEAVALSNPSFVGHTEYIAEQCGADQSRMLLVNDRLRVVHVSTHCSLSRATQLTTKRILDTIVLGSEAVRALGFTTPRVAVCGLNPHAGENGMFGLEESEFIQPAIEAARQQGIACEGPLPADTLFVQAVRGKYDLVVAMYHDQGHIPMKVLDFEHTVNVTLGLPIIRTSVDHGTAFDIAGKNLADPEDMKTAIRLAVSMADQYQQATPSETP